MDRRTPWISPEGPPGTRSGRRVLRTILIKENKLFSASVFFLRMMPCHARLAVLKLKSFIPDFMKNKILIEYI